MVELWRSPPCNFITREAVINFHACRIRKLVSQGSLRRARLFLLTVCLWCCVIWFVRDPIKKKMFHSSVVRSIFSDIPAQASRARLLLRIVPQNEMKLLIEFDEEIRQRWNSISCSGAARDRWHAIFIRCRFVWWWRSWRNPCGDSQHDHPLRANISLSPADTTDPWQQKTKQICIWRSAQNCSNKIISG